MGAIAYTFQIYFDFSGYSDMAIGLGKMFGFQFEENFNYPYTASNITDFWHRWHISLSTWFRDYVYIPLGGNRCEKRRHILNLFVIWFLTGVWHGANWTFIVWGLLYFVILCFEKFCLKPYHSKKLLTKIGYRMATLIIIISAWVIFRAETILQAMIYLKNMFWIGTVPLIDDTAIMFLKEFAVFFLASFIASVPHNYIKDKININIKLVGQSIWIIMIFFISLIYIINSTYNPFIYFNF